MEKQELLARIDHTELRAAAAWPDIRTLCEEAIAYQAAAVCIPPAYVRRVRETYGRRLRICTVVGFPLGYHTTAVKIFEARQAVQDGAAEIDMAVNRGDVKNGDWGKVEAEIAALKRAVGDHILKVIVETCELTTEEKIAVCRAATNGGADYIKTSTGFGAAGATLNDVELFKRHIGPQVKIKAAGGVRSIEDLARFIRSGCDRVGSSAIIRRLKEDAAPK